MRTSLLFQLPNILLVYHRGSERNPKIDTIAPNQTYGVEVTVWYGRWQG